jgi:hypothetical protein
VGVECADVCRRALCGCALAATLSGCGFVASQSVTPAVRIGSAASAVRPQSAGKDLLYISDPGANDVAIYTYPGADLVTKFTGFGSVAGVCADKAGDVFVVDEAGPVQMFAHGGTTPIRKLPTGAPYYAPYGCSVNPSTGDLAVTQLSSYSYAAIAVYRGAKGKPTLYKDKEIDVTWFCTYDGSGNLFADAWDRYGNTILVELPKGAKTFKTFKLGEKFDKPGGVQWDGKYVAVGNYGAGVVYRLTETGHLVQTVTLKRGANVEQFWIAGSTLIGPMAQGSANAAFWHYPTGASSYKAVTGLTWPFGATISP